jgi:glutaredoxin
MPFQKLLARQKPTKPERSHAVTVYSRAGCACCEKALAALRKSAKRHPMQVHIVDIDADPALVDAYGTSVPVIEINGRVRFRGIVNPILLERILEAEGR